MNIDIISNEKIIICLSSEEMYDIFGGYNDIDYENPSSRLALNLLLKSAIGDDDFLANCKRILIEVIPKNDGCSIAFTKIHQDFPRRLKKVFKIDECYTLAFQSFEDLIVCIKEIEKRDMLIYKSSLYHLNKNYILILHTDKCFEKEISHISEYCTVIKGEYNDCIAKEYGKTICESRAIEKLSKNFK